MQLSGKLGEESVTSKLSAVLSEVGGADKESLVMCASMVE
jgi:hypothetical protein